MGIAYQSKKSPFPRAKSDAKAKAISNHKSTMKPKVVAKQQVRKPKSKAAKCNTSDKNKPNGGNDDATHDNSFVDNFTSSHQALPYNAYSTNPSDPYSSFRPFSPAFNSHGFPDIDPYTNGMGDNAQANYISTESGFSLQGLTNVNNVDHYGNGSFRGDPNGFVNLYNGSFDHSSPYPHDGSYVDSQSDDPKNKTALGPDVSELVHIKQEKHEHSGINDESDEDYVDVNKTPKTRKDGTSRKPRQPRIKLLKWNDNDWKQLVLGIVWACGEAGISIPFAQAAQVVHDGCTAGALQQAILKLRVKQNAAGEQVPPLRMAWTRNKTANVANNGDQASTPSKGPTRAMIARRKPTRHRQNQTLMFTFKRAYVEKDRALLPFPYQYDPAADGDVDMEATDEHDRPDSVYTWYDGEEEVILEHSSPKQTIPDQHDFHRNFWLDSDAMNIKAHGQDHCSLSNSIGTQLLKHVTTGPADILGNQFQEHGLTVLNSPIGHQIQEQNHVDLTDSISNHLQESSQAGLHNAYISPQSNLTSGLFSVEKEAQNRMVGVQPTNWDINGLPTGSNTEFSSFEFGLNDSADVPVMSIEHQSRDFSRSEYASLTGEDWSKDMLSIGSNSQLSQGYGSPYTPIFNAPFTLGFNGQSSQPLGDGSSTDPNGVLMVVPKGSIANTRYM
jgi:hypothetical protein